jgi:hypothetical protein
MLESGVNCGVGSTNLILPDQRMDSTSTLVIEGYQPTSVKPSKMNWESNPGGSPQHAQSGF